MEVSQSERKVLALRRLVYADLSFRQTAELCVHIESLDSNEYSAIWMPLLSGVAVSYMKPFTRCDGLGPLPSSFSKFPIDSEHGRTHADLENFRNWCAAHRDIVNSSALLIEANDQNSISEVRLQILDGRIIMHTNEPAWNPAAILRIRELCELQIHRIGDAMKALVHSLAGKKRYVDGVYILGREFP